MSAELIPPPWLTPGARVAEYRETHLRAARVEYATVERLTRTLAILDNGHRYPLITLKIREESRWGATRHLRAADDPQVLAADRAARIDRVHSIATMRADDLLTLWRRDDDHDAARELYTLIGDTLASIDAIRAEGKL